MIEIKAETATKENLKGYGRLLTIPDGVKGSRSDNWECWYDDTLNLPEGFSEYGIVLTRSPIAPISEMEAHTKHELLIPVMHPFIIPMSLKADMDDIDAKPNLRILKAFIIYPGDSFLMDVGIWHSACIPLEDIESSYIFMTSENCLSPGGQRIE